MSKYGKSHRVHWVVNWFSPFYLRETLCELEKFNLLIRDRKFTFISNLKDYIAPGDSIVFPFTLRLF